MGQMVIFYIFYLYFKENSSQMILVFLADTLYLNVVNNCSVVDGTEMLRGFKVDF